LNTCTKKPPNGRPPVPRSVTTDAVEAAIFTHLTKQLGKRGAQRTTLLSALGITDAHAVAQSMANHFGRPLNGNTPPGGWNARDWLATASVADLSARIFEALQLKPAANLTAEVKVEDIVRCIQGIVSEAWRKLHKTNVAAKNIPENTVLGFTGANNGGRFLNVTRVNHANEIARRMGQTLHRSLPKRGKHDPITIRTMAKDMLHAFSHA
jgi:hypothetical protein